MYFQEIEEFQLLKMEFLRGDGVLDNEQYM